jgi:DNA repair exonuclease SbcCD ATPase subunit
MKALRLLDLGLNNFKGLRRFDFSPCGANVSVFGENASGKTTLADGFSWLLFGKDSLGRSDFDIKTLDSAGQALHGLDHAVEAVLDIDGTKIELGKTYREKWTKRRGSAEKEFTGHTKEHFIDAVPVTQSEYEERIELLGSERIFRLLTNPIEFAERIHWQERRRILLETCGDISDADILTSSPELADLSDVLNGRSIEDHRKIVQAQRRKINNQLERIPVRIDEVARSMPTAIISTHGSALGADVGVIQTHLDALRKSRAGMEGERARILSGGEIAEKTKRLREIEADMLSENNRERESREKETERLRAELSNAQAILDGAERAGNRLRREFAEATEELDTLEPRMEAMRTEWHEVDAEAFIPVAGYRNCAACGQALPAGEVDKARGKALADFNASKAKRLEAIADEGKRLRERADVLTADIKSCQENLQTAEKSEREVAESVAKLRERMAVMAEHTFRNPSDGERVLMEEKRLLEADIASLRKGYGDALGRADEKVSELDQQIAAQEAAIAKIHQRRDGEKRIAELKNQERRLAGEFEDLERQLYLCDEFTRRKVSMLTDRINSRFELARFKLFNELINGGIEECCEVSFQGVPWSSLNTGAQVNIGLDIITTLSEHYGIAPPIFIDHAESVTKLIETPGQQIQLMVSESEKTLRMEEAR